MNPQKPSLKPPRMKRRDPDERRKAIAKAALDLFAEQGFERTTTKEIAAKAGVAEGSIYVHFKSKQDILFHFIHNRALPPLKEIFSGQPSRGDREIIRNFIHDRFVLFMELENLIKVIFGEALFHSHLRKALKKNLFSALTQSMETFISQRQKKGVFRNLDTGISSRAFLGMVASFFFFWGFMAEEFPDALPPEQVESVLTDLFLNGISVEKTAPPRLKKAGRKNT